MHHEPSTPSQTSPAKADPPLTFATLVVPGFIANKLISEASKLGFSPVSLAMQKLNQPLRTPFLEQVVKQHVFPN